MFSPQAIVSEKANFSRPNVLVMCYVDVTKAFDSVSHDAILKALESAGAPTSFTNSNTDLRDSLVSEAPLAQSRA